MLLVVHRLGAELDARGVVGHVAVLRRRDEQHMPKVAQRVRLGERVQVGRVGGARVLERQLGEAARVAPLSKAPDAELDQRVGKVEHAEVRPREGEVGMHAREQAPQQLGAQRGARNDRAERVAEERDALRALKQALLRHKRDDLAREILPQLRERGRAGVLFVAGGE